MSKRNKIILILGVIVAVISGFITSKVEHQLLPVSILVLSSFAVLMVVVGEAMRPKTKK